MASMLIVNIRLCFHIIFLWILCDNKVDICLVIILPKKIPWKWKISRSKWRERDVQINARNLFLHLNELRIFCTFDTIYDSIEFIEIRAFVVFIWFGTRKYFESAIISICHRKNKCANKWNEQSKNCGNTRIVVLFKLNWIFVKMTWKIWILVRPKMSSNASISFRAFCRIHRTFIFLLRNEYIWFV